MSTLSLDLQQTDAGNIDEIILKPIMERLQKEEETRADADSKLQEQLDNEIDERAQGDIELNQRIDDEVGALQRRDDELQTQIDDVASRPNFADVLGTHAELDNYDTSKLGNNDIVKVLQDETRGGASTYYRWSTVQNKFIPLGEQGPYYTKAEVDARFVPIARKINNKSLDVDIELTPEDLSMFRITNPEIDNITQ